MQGHVSSYDTRDGRRWRYAVTLGRQHYRRCGRCDTRTWRVSDTVCDRCGRPLGPISEHPARRQISKRGFKTKRNAESKMREVLAEAEADTYTPPTSWTVGDYLSQWIAGYRGKPSTVAGYRLSIDSYLIPRIGPIPLRQLTPERVDACYRELEQSGGRGGRPLAPKTVRGVHVCLRRALQDAVERGHLGRNPAALAHPPSTRGATAKAARDCWDQDQLHRFLEHVADDRLHALWWLLSATGMRRGEVVALRWSDLDGARLTVGARTTTTAAGKVVHQDDGKSDAAARVITLDAKTVAVLRARRQWQLEERMAAGPAWSTDPADGDLMFVHADGRALRPDYVTRRFTQLAKRAGLPYAGGPHRKLRHTYATLALRAGVPVKVVSERVGHADVTVTMQVYQHVGEADDERAAEATAGFLPG